MSFEREFLDSLLGMLGSSRPVLAIRCEKQARVSPRPTGGARVQAHGHEETWPPGMPLAHELSSSPILPRQQRRSDTNPKRERGSDEIK